MIYDSFEWLKTNKIQAQRMVHGIDPLRNNNIRSKEVDYNNFFCIKPNQKETPGQQPGDSFASLLQGQSVLIYSEEEQINDMSTNYETVTKKYLVVHSKSQFSSKRRLEFNQIESFVYGGFTSRFWLMKNYINLKKMKKNEHLPEQMLVWNMISIKLTSSNKFLDLIIPHHR